MNTTEWIARAEREPTREDFPIETWRPNDEIPCRTVKPVNLITATHWRPYRFTPPVIESPAEVQRKVDEKWAQEETSKWWAAPTAVDQSISKYLIAARRLGRDDCKAVVVCMATATGITHPSGTWPRQKDAGIAAARTLCERFWPEDSR